MQIDAWTKYRGDPGPMNSTETVFASLAETAGGWWRDVRLAGAFLTRLPTVAGGPAETPLASAARAFPIVGAAVGLVAGGALLLGWWLGLHPLASAFIGLAAAVVLTGALHEDGLADVADGFGGGATRSEKLKIMRDSRIGAYGVLAVVFSVGVRAAALAGMAGPGTAAAALVAAGAASRGVLPAVMHVLKPARRGGMARSAGRPQKGDAVTAALLGGLLALLFLPVGPGIAAVVAGAAAAAAFAAFAKNQIGGHTGDVLGALQQVTEVAVLLAVAAAGP